MKKLLFVCLLLPVLAGAQNRKQRKAIEEQKKADEIVLTRLKSHIQYLSNDKLEGRRAGSPGEGQAMQYISDQFKSIGLLPKGSESYFQPFVIDEGKKIAPSTYFIANGKTLVLKDDFVPLAFSAGKLVKGSPAIALRESGEPWFTDVKDWLEANKDNPHYDISEALQKEAVKVAGRGATALIVYNSGTAVDNILFNAHDTSAPSKIPVVLITKDGLKKHFTDKSATQNIEMNISMTEKKATAHNVIGYIDNHSPNTVIIGAHYDHLGWGEDENALDTGRVIHNGADDNASGTAALIELARMLSTAKTKSNNYLFIAFSGEELGLLGSKYWLDNPTISVTTNYMVNLDMVGRYNDEHKLTIGGYGTSPEWGKLLSAVTDKSILIRPDSSGGGPSDHAAFYRKNIPVLFFFTGAHSDYHKATDDWDKINYNGELQIIRYVNRIIEAADNKGKLAFAKTVEPQMGRMTQFTVTLGVIPDYGYSGTGLRIDGVSPKKLAEKIGLESGDVLLQLGDYKIKEINSYMQALSQFKKGDKTHLRIKRGTEEKNFELEF